MAFDLFKLTEEARIGNGDNFTAVETTGVLRAEGSAITYRDEYVGGQWVLASANAAPDEVSVTIGGVPTKLYSFDGVNTVERLSNTFEIPHDMVIDKVNDGTFKAEWHVHYAPATTGSGNVKFFFDWCYIPPNGAPIAMTSLSCLKTVNNNQYNNVVCGTELPVPSGGFGIGGLIQFNLRRSPADAQDTYAADVLLFKTALHVPVDTNGSRERYAK